MKKVINIAFETSCDDTAVAVLDSDKVLSNIVYSQKSHEKYGGVVPELASREHMKEIYNATERAIHTAQISKKNIGLVTYTESPGLLGSLLVGKCFAKSFSMAKKIPAIGVNHINGHILSPFLNKNFVPKFPHIALTVSGGHSQIILVKDFLDFEILGTTLDDAVGEAFDKIGKMLHLGYPAGHLIDEYSKNGNENKFVFCKPSVPHLDYSFSGIKTFFMNFLKKKVAENENFISHNLADLCASIQKKLIDMLLEKLAKALEKFTHDIKAISLVGGVASNRKLRQEVENICMEKNLEYYVPEKKFCTDNAAMIGLVGYHAFLQKLNNGNN